MESLASDVVKDNCYPFTISDRYDDDQDFEPYVVVGIDFGTAGTAFAFQLRTDYENNKHDIYYDEYLSRYGKKNSTSLLIRNDYLKSYFGVEAENKYRQLQQREDWHFFRHFKMQMYRDRTQQDIDNETQLTAEGGEKVPAVNVFAESLKCIKREVDKFLVEAFGSCLEKTKKWVITVPAIWSDGAKTIMRSAAEQAGIESKYLSLALEPEAGAIYYAVTGANPPNDPNRKMEFPVHIGPGSTFMVVDIGAGTVDITTMTIMQNGKAKQIHESDGGPAGGENVDRKLIALVAKLLGEKPWLKFAKESSRKYAQFRDSVEAAKKDLKPTKTVGETDEILLYVPEEILRDFAREKEMDLESAIRKAGEKLIEGGVELEDGQLCFKADLLRKLMQESVVEILTFINDIIKSEQNKRKNIKAVILVGGFALSDFLYSEIQKEIKSVRILRPLSCDKAVLRGAVLFGHNERILSVRITRLTYGIKSFKPFKSKDPLERKVIIDGKDYVKDCFSKHVTRGQEVHIDEWTPPREYKPQCNFEAQTTIFIYSSNANAPRYVDEDSCKSIGRLVLDFTRETGELNLLDVSFNFGRTELLAKVTHRSSGVSTVESVRFQSI